MQSLSSIKLYSLGYTEVRTYFVATLFIVGNILFPQLVHLMPHGGATWLPIYLFTLVGAYKYGWKVGVLTAIASPLVNSMAFGMPCASVLPSILAKSLLLAAFAGVAARCIKDAPLWAFAAIVVAYQVLGTAFEWMLIGNLTIALQDLRQGAPGLALQVLGGWWLVRLIGRRGFDAGAQQE